MMRSVTGMSDFDIRPIFVMSTTLVGYAWLYDGVQWLRLDMMRINYALSLCLSLPYMSLALALAGG